MPPVHSDEPLIRVISPGGAFVRRVRLSEAHYLCRTKQGKWAGKATRKRAGDCIQLLSASVEMRIPMPTAYTYNERLGEHATQRLTRHTLTVLKRVDNDGVLHKWDPHLTFAEARAGRYVSEMTLMQRRLRNIGLEAQA